MDEEASDKLVGLERHGFVAVMLFGAVVLPLKGDVVSIGVDEARVSDGDAVGVSREVLENGAWSGKRWSSIDIPLTVAQASDESFEGARVSQRLELGKEAQALLAIQCEEFIEEQTSEQSGEDVDVDEEVVARGEPRFAIEGETTARDDAVQVRMME